MWCKTVMVSWAALKEWSGWRVNVWQCGARRIAPVACGAARQMAPAPRTLEGNRHSADIHSSRKLDDTTRSAAERRNRRPRQHRGLSQTSSTHLTYTRSIKRWTAKQPRRCRSLLQAHQHPPTTQKLSPSQVVLTSSSSPSSSPSSPDHTHCSPSPPRPGFLPRSS